MSRIVRRANTNAPLIAGPIGAKRVIIEDLELYGNNQAQSTGKAHIVNLADAPGTEDTQWVVSRCYIHGRIDPRDGSWGSGGSNVYIGSGRMACHVENSVSAYANVHGFEINGADAVIDACIVGDNGADGIVIGAWVTTVTACAVFNNVHGMFVADTGNGSPKRILISGNGVDRNRRNGLLLDKGAATGATGVSIMNTPSRRTAPSATKCGLTSASWPRRATSPSAATSSPWSKMVTRIEPPRRLSLVPERPRSTWATSTRAGRSAASPMPRVRCTPRPGRPDLRSAGHGQHPAPAGKRAEPWRPGEPSGIPPHLPYAAEPAGAHARCAGGRGSGQARG